MLFRSLNFGYELVLWTDAMNTADPIVDRIDPKRRIRHRLYRDTTTFSKGHHLKDLSVLNRDLKKVLILDTSEEAFSDPVGVLVNNVGMSYPFAQWLHELSDDEVQALLSMNVESTTWMTRLVIPGMLKRKKGAVVNLSSAAARMPLTPGSYVALATPMLDNGDLDIPTLRSVLQWHKAEGTDGVVILGTTGEASTLSSEEKEEVMAVTRDELGGVIPIVVGTGTISTTQTITATKQAQRMGADAALVVTPYYVKPSAAGLVSHFTSIADACDIPIIMYNVPEIGRASCRERV